MNKQTPERKAPNTRLPGHIDFNRFPDGSAHLDSLSRSKLSPEDIQDIVRICNQREVKYWLFRQLLDDKPYTSDTADHWIDKIARDGWRLNSNFVYLIKNNESRVVGAINIKTKDLDDAEIGYWADSNERGYMTNAAMALIEQAKLAGYTKIYALIEKGNSRSYRVVSRLGFKLVSNNYERDDIVHDRYELKLDENN